MIIVTNPASNLPSDLIEMHGIVLTPQRIIRDGETHDATHLASEIEVDALVANAKTHPHILGTSAPEFVTLFRDLAARDHEIVVVTSSRKSSGSYDAAVAASRTLQNMPLYREVKISVVDSANADIGAGLIALFCAISARLGIERTVIATAASVLATKGVLGLVPTTFDYLMKSGRASFLKTMVATLMHKLPVIGLADGELTPITTINKSDSIPEAIVAQLIKDLGKGRAIWAGVAHGHNPDGARQLASLLRTAFDVRLVIERTLAPGIYLNVGPSVATAVYPVDAMPWVVSL